MPTFRVIAKPRREKGKERASSYFVWPGSQTRSRSVTSRWGFQLRYHRENNISRALKKHIECACTKDVKMIRDVYSIPMTAKSIEENTIFFPILIIH